MSAEMLSILTGGLDYAREHYDHKSPNPTPIHLQTICTVNTSSYHIYSHTNTMCNIQCIHRHTNLSDTAWTGLITPHSNFTTEIQSPK